MSEDAPKLDSLFAAAVEIESPEQRAAFIRSSCGDNHALRRELELLLESDKQAGGFLDKPPSVIEATVLADVSDDNRSASLEVGLATALLPSEAVVIGHAGHSVLQSLGKTCAVPRIALRESPAEASDPIVRPKSAEMPQRASDSRYRLDGEIARGGMGAILKGRDTDLGRDLAIKVLLDQHKDKPEVIQRFIEEAQIGGQLQHPGITPIYELGQFADRRPFFAMKLVKGETLSKLLSDRSEPSSDRGRFLSIFEQVCQTMAYAHSRGVIHRDLKPANIMVGSFGEVQVMDWGLAKVLPAGGVADEKKSLARQHGHSIIQTLRSGVGSDTPFGAVGSQTQMGSVMGTPAYMPPEQALGEIDHLDERADVFGLGAILCEILTGKPPYVGTDGTAVFRQASRGRLNDCMGRLDACGADADLIALAKHCLELEPSDRPRDAGALAEGISRYLESVESRLRETEMKRVAETARANAEAAQAEAERQRAESESLRLVQQRRSATRLRKMIACLAAVATVAVGTSIVAARFWQDATVARKTAEENERQAKENAETATKNEILANQNAEIATKNEQIAQKEAARANVQTQLANDQKEVAEQNLAKAERSEKEANQQRNRADQVAEFAQRNLYYAQMSLGQQAWREYRGLPQMRDLLDNWIPKEDSLDRRGWEWFYLNALPFQNVRTLSVGGPQAGRSVLAWHIPSNRLAEVRADGRILIWNVDREQTTLILQAPPQPDYWTRGRPLAWSPDGRRLACGGQDGAVHIWETDSGREILVLSGSDSIQTVAFHSESDRVAVWSNDGLIRICDVDSGRLRTTINHPVGCITGAWSPDGNNVASGYGNGAITVSGIQAGDERVTLHDHSGPIEDLEWCPDGTRLASASDDFTARIWDLESRKVCVEPLRHSHRVMALSWSPDGQRLATSAMDHANKVWDTNSGLEVATLRGHDLWIGSLCWGPSGQLASASVDGRLVIWNSIRDQQAFTLSGSPGPTMAAVWSLDGKRLAWGGHDGQLRIWDWTTRQQVAVEQVGPIQSISCSMDGTRVAVVCNEGTAKVWDVASAREILSVAADHGRIHAASLNSDGSQLAVGFHDGTIRLVQGVDQRPRIHDFQAHRSQVLAVAWNPAGDCVASGGADGSVNLWDSVHRTERVSLQEHPGFVRTVAWSPDGLRLASGSDDRRVVVWDVQAGRRISTMLGHYDYVFSVCWSPDGTRVASAGLDNAVRFWDPGTGEQTFALRGDAGMFQSVSWHPDGAQLAAANTDGKIWIWDATRGYQRDVTARALPFIDRAVAGGAARGGDLIWYAESYIRAGKLAEALKVAQNDLPSLAQLARHLANLGSDLQVEDAIAKLNATLRQQRLPQPTNETMARDVADLLLISGRRWTVLTPIEMKSDGGATLTLQSDGSILASGTNASGDVYTITADSGLDRIRAIQLEALPDRNLPNNGPGRHSSGNFQLSALRLFHPPAAGESEPARLKLKSAWASFHYKAHDADISGIVDEHLNKVWHVWGRPGERHRAIFTVQEPTGSTRGRPVVIQLYHKNLNEGLNLGRFRLSATDDDYEQQRRAALEQTDPWIRLAAAYSISGDQSSFDTLVQRHPIAGAYLGDQFAAVQDWEQAIAQYGKVITDAAPNVQLLAKRASAYEELDNWDAAAGDWIRAAPLHPDGPKLLAEFTSRIAAGAVPLLESTRRELRELLEAQIMKAPMDRHWIAALADMLLNDRTGSDAKWTVVTPVEMRTETGARMERLKDASIFVHASSSDQSDTYTLVLPSELKGIKALRLEVLADSRLPRGGSGWGASGNFLLNELTLEAAPAGTPDQAKSIPFRNATADFNQRVSGGWGINGAIDGDDRTAWGVYPEVKQNHLAVFELAEDPGAGEGVRLTARLKHSSQYSNHNIGRFRMWVTDNSAVVSRELRWMAVRKVTDPLTRLAAAYHISGDQPGLDTLLQRHPEAGIYLADLYAADQDWERAIVEYRKVLSARPTDFSTLMKLTATLHAAGSPREAMSYMATASALDPKNSTLFLNVAAKQAWFEMENELNETCGRALKFSEDSSDPNYLERTAKICCLISVNDNARAESARTLAIKAIELVKDNGDLPWFQMALGMAEYRCGNFAEADAAMQVASESAASTPLIRGPATFFRAMSLYRQGQSDAARKLVDEAAAKMKPLPTTDRAAANAYHDEIIVWLAYKEAMGLIKFEAPTANPVKP